VLEVRGHADASGPEHQEGDKPGNMNISRDRANSVIKFLESAGILMSNITYKGLGLSELIHNIGRRSGQQRRVPFFIVSK
jgi:outer membrane protein OmpA-like peptidoglycan-associated protein